MFEKAQKFIVVAFLALVSFGAQALPARDQRKIRLFAVGFLLNGCTSLNLQTRVASPHRALSSAPIKHHYFGGTETNYKPDGKTVNYTVQYYCLRTLDPDAGSLEEHTLLIFENGKSAEFDTKMAIADDGSTFSVIDLTNSVSGGGKLIGPPWAWTGLTAVFKRKNGMRTEDVNILSDDFIAGFKKDYSAPTTAQPDGKLSDLDVAILRKITQDEYERVMSAVHAKK